MESKKVRCIIQIVFCSFFLLTLAGIFTLLIHLGIISSGLIPIWATFLIAVMLPPIIRPIGAIAWILVIFI